ncbi:Gfo/Idh/MocA family protein [Salinispora arenicola]|uniref:Gfo/Idh/MocA family protein n=1 Tax=Salinispora arenicola TaxID=168697 RepID=UPI00207A62F3|nr:Gfo/Idh/MocA family oxidoreductase [Salinispora arenicola]MCN0155277.1 Gfo/Idh/MocA family oxidoreductase [Salinispora arenicola]
MKNGKSVGLGVLGCADVAARRVLPAVVASSSIHLVAVASRDWKRAERYVRQHGGDAVTGYEALLDRDDVDAVYVPLPAGLHAEWIERALRAGKHVLGEKPLTTSIDDTRRLFELAEKLGLVMHENFMFCNHPMHAEVLRLAASGAVGDVRSFSATFTIPGRPDGDIRLRPDLGGGALYDTGGYPLRAAQMFLGPELEVRGAFLRSAESAVDLGGSVLLVRPDDGVWANLTFGLDDAYRSTYALAGSAGRIEVDHVFTPPADHLPTARLTTPSGTVLVSLPAYDQYRASAQRFADAVLGATAFPSPEAVTSINQARLTDEIHEFAQALGPPAHRYPEEES